MSIDDILDRIYPISETAKNKIRDLIFRVDFPKGHILFKAEKRENHLYFIRKGMVRAYADTTNGPTTFWFGKEGQAALSMRNYVENRFSYENIELIEDSSFFGIGMENLQTLFATDIEWANWGRKLAESELIQAENRLISLQFQSAKERYQALMNEHPDILLRVPLQYIASYLGITPVSLSRIRAEIK